MTSPALLVARLVLAGVFAVAALAKLADRAGTRQAVAGFGVPASSVAALAVALPVLELAVACLLVPASTALYGAVGALALLTVFSLAIAWNLVRGRAPECHCFGQLHSAPATWRTLVRNGVLLAIAGLVLVDAATLQPASASWWIVDLSGTELVALVTSTGLAVVLLGGVAGFVSLLRSYGRVLNRLDLVESALAAAGISVDAGLELPERGLRPGTPTPFFAATAIGGEQVSAQTLAEASMPTLLLFTSPHCGPCTELMPTVVKWQREHGDRLSVVVTSSGSEEEVREEARRHGLERVLHDADNRLSDLFEANETPSAVLVAPDGTIASWVASGAEWIEQLVASAVEDGNEGGLPVGADAPALELPSLTGETTSLTSMQGRDSVVLFWNPDCGFCRSMHEDVLAWEESANGVTPQLVVVSSGNAASTRAEGFRSLVLLDQDFAASTAFSAGGTPMAVLVDAEGRIASPVVAGAEAVLALANGQR